MCLYLARFPTLLGKYYTDTMFASKKSARMFKTAQIFTNGKGFDYLYPMVDNIALLLRTHTPVRLNLSACAIHCCQCFTSMLIEYRSETAVKRDL
jgi:hypothetical protein